MATGSGARPLRADAVRNRRSVTEAAREAFARHGVTASLDDVARAAGVGPGTLYRHFPSRDDLILAVINEGLADLHRLGVELLDETDPLKAVSRWLEAYIEQCGMYDGLAQALARTPVHESDNCRLSIDAGTELIRRAADAGALRADSDADDIRHLAAAIAWISGQLPPEPHRRTRLLRMMLDGLRPR
ncbi:MULTISPECIES: TetR/AcrR family transcriptional regulator [unclassified Streptomyces]|uniref:TetR/AcrR family transcriptional regulator n=1 Tax=unclassified Streptomyces TaxID=2593676 RepID=UPI003656A5F9